MNTSLENYLIVDALEEQLHRWSLCGAAEDSCQVRAHKELVEKYRNRTLAKEIKAYACSLREQVEAADDWEEAEVMKNLADTLEKAATAMEEME